MRIQKHVVNTYDLYDISETIKVYDGYSSLRKRLFRTVTVSKQASKEDLLIAAMRAFVVTQDRCNFYLLDVYANCDCDRDTEIEDPLPVQRYHFFVNVKSSICYS